MTRALSDSRPFREVRAVYDEKTIRVYQAYSDLIADTALEKGTFISPPFKMQRMTWIKPSFLWMMYRSGYGLRDVEQKRILAIDISRIGFEWALTHGCLSERSRACRDKGPNLPPVRIQWDPERDVLLRPLNWRTIQVGLREKAITLFVNEWIHRITDVTESAHAVRDLVERDQFAQAHELLPKERPYPLHRALEAHIGVAPYAV